VTHLWPAILLESLYAALSAAPDFRPHVLGFEALTFAASVVAFAFAARVRPRQSLLWGALFRATLLFRSPDLSDDVYRYAWDGRVAAAGISPYRHAPADPSVAFLRDGDWTRMSHRDARTVYPPAAQALFRAAAATGRPVSAMKVFAAIADLSVVWLLSLFPGGETAAALYASLPLAVFESAGMGHVDSVGVALLVAAALLVTSGRRALSGAGFAASVAVKYIPAAAVLPLLRAGRSRFAAAGAATLAALWIFGSAGGSDPLSGMGNFALRWEANAIVYPAVRRGVEAVRLPQRAKAAYAQWKSRRPSEPWMERIWPYFYSALFARILLAMAGGAGLFLIALRCAEPIAAIAASLALLLVLSPVLHPWYALWLLPFALLARRPAFLLFSLSVPLAYLLAYPVAGVPAAGVLGLEYAPAAILMFWKRR
jgi:alpha-1,6-mannosyltransferase